MDYTLKILGQIAGIGGISIGVFLILFREVIRKNIFPHLTEKDAYNLLKLIVILVWSIAVLGISAYIYLTLSEKTENHSVKSLSDIKIIEINTGKCSVEFKLKNQGSDSAFITGIKFNSIPKLLHSCAFVPSHTYKYKIENKDNKFIVTDFIETLKLSQRVPPKGVDRFRIDFEINPEITCSDIIYHGNVTIFYDGGKKIVSPNFNIVFMKMEK